MRTDPEVVCSIFNDDFEANNFGYGIADDV